MFADSKIYGDSSSMPTHTINQTITARLPQAQSKQTSLTPLAAQPVLPPKEQVVVDYKTLENEIDPKIFMNLDIEEAVP